MLMIKWWINKILQHSIMMTRNLIIILLLQINNPFIHLMITGEKVRRSWSRQQRRRWNWRRQQNSSYIVASRYNWTIVIVFSFVRCYNKTWIIRWSFYSFFDTAILSCAFVITSARKIKKDTKIMIKLVR